MLKEAAVVTGLVVGAGMIEAVKPPAPTTLFLAQNQSSHYAGQVFWNAVERSMQERDSLPTKPLLITRKFFEDHFLTDITRDYNTDASDPSQPIYLPEADELYPFDRDSELRNNLLQVPFIGSNLENFFSSFEMNRFLDLNRLNAKIYDATKNSTSFRLLRSFPWHFAGIGLTEEQIDFLSAHGLTSVHIRTHSYDKKGISHTEVTDLTYELDTLRQTIEESSDGQVYVLIPLGRSVLPDDAIFPKLDVNVRFSFLLPEGYFPRRKYIGPDFFAFHSGKTRPAGSSIFVQR